MESSTEGQVAGLTALDRAYDRRLAGDADAALRMAAGVLAAHPEDLGAVLLVCRVLVDADRVAVAGQALEVLVDAMARRGDLPGAIVAARLADEAGGFAPGALRTLASLFCSEAPRQGEGSLRPPPIPVQTKAASNFDNLRGEALFGAAEQVLAAFVAHKSTPQPPFEAPRLPLFGDLPEAALLQLFGALEVQELPSQAAAIVEGELGHDAFFVVRGLLHVMRGHPPTQLASLGAGSIFGEMALLADSPRAASVIAAQPTLLLSVSRDHLNTLSRLTPALGEQLGQFCYDRMLANLMRHSPIFASVDESERHALLSRFVVKRYAEGDWLLREGAQNARLSVIASGEVEVLRRDREGDQLRLAELGPGSVVGEMSLVLRRPASADVRAQCSTVTLELSADDFQAAIKAYPALLSELYALATARDDETRSVLAQPAVDVGDSILL